MIFWKYLETSEETDGIDLQQPSPILVNFKITSLVNLKKEKP